MKNIFLIIAVLGLFMQLSAQEIKVSSTCSFSTYNAFSSNFGYVVGYDFFNNSKSRSGVSFTQTFNNTNYSGSYFYDAYGETYYYKIEPENQRLGLYFDYGYNLSNSVNHSIFIGFKLGLNFLYFDGIIHERKYKESEYTTYNSNGRWENNKFGAGVIFEYNKKITDKISIYASVEPEAVFYRRLYASSDMNPPMIGFINFNLGIKFNTKH